METMFVSRERAKQILGLSDVSLNKKARKLDLLRLKDDSGRVWYFRNEVEKLAADRREVASL